jgi:hypothetical protein
VRKASKDTSDNLPSGNSLVPYKRGDVTPSPFSVLVLNAVKYVLDAHDTHSAVDAEKYDACISFLVSRSPEWLKRELSFTRNL